MKLRHILARLDAAGTVEDMGLPGSNWHPLKGELKAFGPLPFAPIGGVFSASWIMMRPFDYTDYHR